MQAEGLDEDRIVFGKFVPTAQENWHRLQAGTHVVLDTHWLPRTARTHTGAVDALWAGLPLLTCVDECITAPHEATDADQMVARIGASLLTAAGLEKELVAHSLDDLKAKVVALAANASKYAEVSASVERARTHTGALQSQRKALELSKGLTTL